MFVRASNDYENCLCKFGSSETGEVVLHDAGVGFMDIHTSKEKADQMVAQLREANPAIEVKHINYL